MLKRHGYTFSYFRCTVTFFVCVLSAHAPKVSKGTEDEPLKCPFVPSLLPLPSRAVLGTHAFVHSAV